MVYKHFVVHPDTVMGAHMAACAADMQGKFKEFTKAFWTKGFGVYAQTRDASAMGGENLLKIAAEAGLDTKKLEADMKGETCVGRVRANMELLGKFGVGGTPSFFINGKFAMFGGAGPFKKLIDDELKAVEASGIPADQFYQKAVLEQGSKVFVSRADAMKNK